MSESDEQAMITESLDICSERGGDIVPAVFEQFFACDEQARGLMQYSDRHMQGRMFEATIGLFLDEDYLGPGNYLDWELGNHLDAYGATPAMYLSFFDSIIVVVKRLAGPDWNGDCERAWSERVARIMTQVNNHPGSQQAPGDETVAG